MSKPSDLPLRPLCVDLDGTLVKTDTFAQALLLLARKKPLFLINGLLGAHRGLAALKKEVAQHVALDPAALPTNEPLLVFLKKEKETGREILLVTASDESVAQRVADHTGLFTEVIGSDGTVNLKSKYKRGALVERFGAGGFDYIGNSSDDIAVWASSEETLVANPSRKVIQALHDTPHTLFEDRPAPLRSWIKALRVHQWVKNVLIFLPMLLAHTLNDPTKYIEAVIAFFSFSFLASAIYLLNDLFDLHADQKHPRKCQRPLAAGNLELNAAVIAIPVLVVASLLLACQLPLLFCGILFGYLLITTLYSWQVKQWPLLDVLTLAGLFTVRILAGTAAYGVPTSGWLIAFSTSIFFSLALVKRYAEVREAVDTDPSTQRIRGYSPRHMPWLAGVGIISGAIAAVVLGLYITSDKVVEFYKTPALLWGLCPLVLYWIGRIWSLARSSKLSDDPLEFAARDPQTWAIGAIGVALLIVGAL